MTKKVLIIGNSHIASLKNGWDLLKQQKRETSELLFLGARRDRVSKLEITNGCLYSHNDEVSKSFEYTFGNKQVDLNVLKPSAILFYGMDMHIPIEFFYKSASGLFSKAVQNIAFSDMVNTAWSFKVIQRVRAHFSGSIYVAMPFRASPTPQANEVSSALEKNNADFIKTVAYANRCFYRRLGIEYIPQPFETFDVETFRSHFSFSQGSTRLAVGFDNDDEQHPETDLNHMNAEFGAIFLRKMIDTINGV